MWSDIVILKLPAWIILVQHDVWWFVRENIPRDAQHTPNIFGTALVNVRVLKRLRGYSALYSIMSFLAVPGWNITATWRHPSKCTFVINVVIISVSSRERWSERASHSRVETDDSFFILIERSTESRNIEWVFPTVVKPSNDRLYELSTLVW